MFFATSLFNKPLFAQYFFQIAQTIKRPLETLAILTLNLEVQYESVISIDKLIRVFVRIKSR